MHEILRSLPAGSYVLDLGCAQGSFTETATAARIVRVDRDPPRDGAARFVQADAAALPFADHTFAAVISNHSLEHFDDFDGALREIGRVIQPTGALFVAVPDASTVTDKIYRWLAKGGGHVNAFISAGEIAVEIETVTGLRHVATRLLCSSLSFLNRRNAPGPPPRKLLLLGGGHEWSLFWYAWLSRRLDRSLHTRTSMYGWALYFGSIEEPIDTETWVNVCIRCGSGCSAAELRERRLVRSGFLGMAVFECKECGAMNPFAEDG
jgi:SAM-dependent methyltransferase